MTPQLALRLGRVSNLPTVWSNTLAASALAGAQLQLAQGVLLCAAFSAFYVGGMFLNDAFDARHDAAHRPERPIPSGDASEREVFMWGGALLLLGELGLVLHGAWFQARLAPAPLLAGALLAGLIVLYDAYHKNNPMSPLLMGLCRVGVYVAVGFAVADVPDPWLWVGALALLAYLIGLTYVAKQEHLRAVRNLWPLLFLAAPFGLAISELATSMSLGWHARGLFAGAVLGGFLLWVLRALRYLVPKAGPPQIGRAVVALIAGISLWDALAASLMGQGAVAVFAILAFLLTLYGQRLVSGT